MNELHKIALIELIRNYKQLDEIAETINQMFEGEIYSTLDSNVIMRSFGFPDNKCENPMLSCVECLRTPGEVCIHPDYITDIWEDKIDELNSVQMFEYLIAELDTLRRDCTGLFLKEDAS